MSKLMKKVLREARKNGEFQIFIQGVEKWNHYDTVTQTTPEGPKEDGHYDVEGHSWCDVEALFRLNLFNKDDLKAYLRELWGWTADFCKFFFADFPNWTCMKSAFSFIKEANLSLDWSMWTWTVLNVSVIKDEIINEKLAKHLGGHKKELQLMKSNYKEYAKIRDEVTVQTSFHEVLKTLNNKDKYVYIGGNLWVSKENYTNIVSDWICDMKSGYSDEKIAKIIAYWCSKVALLHLPVRLFKEKPTRGIWRSLQVTSKLLDLGVLKTYPAEEVFAELDARIAAKLGSSKKDDDGQA